MDTKQFYLQLQHDAEMIAEKAAAVLRSYENTFTTVNQKDEADLATSADIASEKLIIEEIKKRYPTHAIYSEEAGEIPGTEPYTWIIDPLDGTKEYARHALEYNCLLAVEDKGSIVAGAMKRNGNNELYVASQGNGVLYNKKPIKVANTNDCSVALISMHLPTLKFSEKDIQKDLAILNNLIHHCYRVRGLYDEAQAFSWVAQGILDAHIFVPGGAHFHDVAPGMLFVTEAGGMVTDWEGNPIKNRDLSHGVIASNGKIHNQLLQLIQKAANGT